MNDEYFIVVRGKRSDKEELRNFWTGVLVKGMPNLELVEELPSDYQSKIKAYAIKGETIRTPLVLLMAIRDTYKVVGKSS